MAKLLRIRDYVLLVASGIYDVVDLIPSHKQTIYGFTSKKNNYYSAVSRMLRAGEIKREINKKGNVSLVLTSKGRFLYKRKFSLFELQKKKWDGKFMVVVYDIDEKFSTKRSLLRRKLVELGFGMLQKSVWVSPYHFEEDMREFVVENGLENMVFVMTARSAFTGNIKKLAAKIWDLGKVNAGYTKVINLVKKGDKKTAMKLYLNTLKADPLLPGELLPNYWNRTKALKGLNKKN